MNFMKRSFVNGANCRCKSPLHAAVIAKFSASLEPRISALCKDDKTFRLHSIRHSKSIINQKYNYSSSSDGLVEIDEFSCR